MDSSLGPTLVNLIMAELEKKKNATIDRIIKIKTLYKIC